jgi:integral membrane protein (TIGR01906 family)
LNSDKKRIILTTVLWVILSFFLPLTLLLFNLEQTAFDVRFYVSELEKYNIQREMDIAQDDLVTAVQNLLEYLKGERFTPQSEVTIKSERVDIFGERELAHLEDVRELFKRGFVLKRFSFAASVLLLIGLYFSRRPDPLPTVLKALFKSCIAGLLVLILFISTVLLNFSTSFTYFHLIFFDNDLWLLDPATENLIKMFPEGFFFDAAFRVLKKTFLQLSLIAVFTGFAKRYFPKGG